MNDTFLSPFSAQRRGNWVRLRTMILLRWMAIVGQLSAISIAIAFYSLQLELALCLVAISILRFRAYVAPLITLRVLKCDGCTPP
jgi:two-component system sensor histidine kinase RegB